MKGDVRYGVCGRDEELCGSYGRIYIFWWLTCRGGEMLAV